MADILVMYVYAGKSCPDSKPALPPRQLIAPKAGAGFD